MEDQTNVKTVHVSKNRKKSWRKHSNIEDIEEYLEDQRQEERLGGPVSKKADDALFFVDNSISINEKESGIEDKKKKCRRLLEEEMNRVFFTSLVPPVSVPRCNTRQMKKRMIKPYKVKPQPKKKIPEKPEQKVYDLWDPKLSAKDEIEVLSHEVLRNLTPKVPIHRFQKPSLLPSVQVPHPGASYNPSYEDHQALLAAAHEVELKKLKQEQHLDRVLTNMLPTKENAPTLQSWIDEMSVGFFETNEEEKEEEEENDGEKELKTWGKPIDREKRKIRVKRNAEKRRRKKDVELEKQKLDKQFRNQFERIKQYKREIITKENISAELHRKREAKRRDAMFKPHRIGSEKYQVPDLEIKLSDELVGTLRECKAEGSVLEDRYKSFQRRNIIETRTRKKMVRKYKRKKQVKRNHREAQAEIDACIKAAKPIKKKKKKVKSIKIQTPAV